MDRIESHLIEMVTRGVACLKINVHTSRDFINKSKKGAFTNSVDLKRRCILRRLIRVCAICHIKHILGNGGQY